MAQHPQKLEVHFTHPRESGSLFTAEVAPYCTGAQAIQGLIGASFLTPPPEGRPYTLAVDRTGQQITPNMTLEQAGVIVGQRVLQRFQTRCG